MILQVEIRAHSFWVHFGNMYCAMNAAWIPSIPLRQTISPFAFGFPPLQLLPWHQQLWN